LSEAPSKVTCFNHRLTTNTLLEHINMSILCVVSDRPHGEMLAGGLTITAVLGFEHISTKAALGMVIMLLWIFFKLWKRRLLYVGQRS
jgi:hypothetical protein